MYKFVKYSRELKVVITRLYEKSPPPNPRGEDRGAHSLNYVVV
jgi:hypothetical protein